MMKEPNYQRVVEQGRELAEALGIEVPKELQVQYGPPSSRFNQVLGAVADLLEKANAEFEPENVKTGKAKVEKKK